MPDLTKEDLKIGFVVGLKVSKSAVKRNRLKRQMREVVRLLLQENKIRRGSMMLFIAKKEMLQKEYQEIEKNIIQALLNARVLLRPLMASKSSIMLHSHE